MLYTLNNKTIRIPDEDLKKAMTALDLTRDEAIQMWLEDEGYLDNEEQEALDEKAKANKVSIGAKSERKKAVTKPRERKPDEVKDKFVQDLCNYLAEMGYSDAKVAIIGKKIDFSIGNDQFSLDLVRHRAKKA